LDAALPKLGPRKKSWVPLSCSRPTYALPKLLAGNILVLDSTAQESTRTTYKNQLHTIDMNMAAQSEILEPLQVVIVAAPLNHLFFSKKSLVAYLLSNNYLCIRDIIQMIFR